MSRRNESGESLEQTIERSRIQQGLLVYSLCKGEVLQAVISGLTPEEIKVEEDRTITARSLGARNGALEILGDTAQEDSWAGHTVCLGSYTFSVAGIGFKRPGILRGMINKSSNVVIDLEAQHFVGNNSPKLLLAEYETLFLEGEMIF